MRAAVDIDAGIAVFDADRLPYGLRCAERAVRGDTRRNRVGPGGAYWRGAERAVGAHPARLRLLRDDKP